MITAYALESSVAMYACVQLRPGGLVWIQLVVGKYVIRESVELIVTFGEMARRQTTQIASKRATFER